MKRFTSTLFIIFGILASVGLQGQAVAELVVEFSIDEGESFTNGFEFSVGQQQQVGVYLVEQSGDNTLESEGLLGFGLRAGLGSATSSQIAGASISSAFDFIATESHSDVDLEWSAAVLDNDVPANSAILVGEVTFTSTEIGVNTFSVMDRNIGSGTPNIDWLSGTGRELDQAIFGESSSRSYELVISSVPEPSSASTMAIAALALLVFRRRLH